MRIWAIILLLGLFSSDLHAQAQDSCALPPRLTANMPGRVRAVGLSGNNLRVSGGLTAEITGQLANHTEFIVQSPPTCIDGLYWYDVETLDGIRGWTAEGENGLYWLEPTPFCTEQQRAAKMTYRLDSQSGTNFDRLINAQYVPERKSILIASEPENPNRRFNEPPHPALLDYHWFNLETQIMTPAVYPDADIVTPELTDKLGITDYVFGVKSREFYSLHVSPEHDRILYFIDNPPIENCAHGCYTAQMWVADVDGSNQVEVGTLIMGDAGYIAWEWGSNGRIYLTMISGDASYSIVEICDDGSCFNRSDEAFPYFYGFPAVSPNGEYLTVVDMSQTNHFFGNHRLLEINSGSWTDLPLAGWLTPAVWSADGETIYVVGWFNDGLSLAATRLNQLNRVEMLLDEVYMGHPPRWDIAEDVPLIYIGEAHFGLTLHCW